MRRHFAMAWLVSGALVVAGCGTHSPSGAPASSPSNAGPVYNGQTAELEARHLLTLVRLPPNARRSAHQPAGTAPRLSSYSVNVPFAPHLVDLHEFYTASGTPASVIGWAEGHRPPGSRQSDSGDADQHARWTSFSFPSIKGFAVSDLVLDAVPVHGGTVAIRVDAQVAPRPRLPGDGRGPGDIRIVEGADMLGSFGYELRCDPAGGTVPDPARMCAAIARKPALLYSFPGPGHSCPFGNSYVSLAGEWNGKPLHSRFSVCTGGQEELAISWAKLLPGTTAVGTVHIDRGIGLVRLGEPESAVVDLLRGLHAAPAPCSKCTRSFDEDFSIGYGARGAERGRWTISFAASRVARIETDVDVKMRGGYMSFGFARFRQRLPGWHVSTCGSGRALVHSSSTGRTLVLFHGSTFQRIVVTAARTGC